MNRFGQLLTVFLLGVSSGLPLALTASGGTFQAFATANGFSLAQLGALTFLTLPYALKFLWAPLFDRFKCPLIGFLGFRRGWLVATQLLLASLYMALGALTEADATLVAVLFGISFMSASQDIAIDAYRAEVLAPELRGAGAYLAVTGYRIGMIISGAGALALGGDVFEWSQVLAGCALVQLLAILPTVFAPAEPNIPRPRTLLSAVVQPFAEFLSRRGAIEVLIFVFLYKAPDALGTLFTTRFLLDCGFAKAEIAAVVKGIGLIATLGGGLAAGWLMLKIPLRQALMAFGLFQAITILPFILLAQTSTPNSSLLTLVIVAESLGSGASGTVFVAFLMAVCKQELAATQFALLSSIAALARSLLGPAAGKLAGSLGWETYFLIATLSNIPALLLLFLRGRLWTDGTGKQL
jgi:PAT family beta-lactamase induction signal transducer AmpG